MINITLAQDDWMRILNILAEQPFKLVAPLIQNMQQQILPQLPKPSQANGELHPEARTDAV
jgi:hypothetical protein